MAYTDIDYILKAFQFAFKCEKEQAQTMLRSWEFGEKELEKWAKQRPTLIAKLVQKLIEDGVNDYDGSYNSYEYEQKLNDAEDVLIKLFGITCEWPGLYPILVSPDKKRWIFEENVVLQVVKHVTSTHKVTKDGKEISRGTENECFMWLIDNTPFSVSHATKYEGYTIEPIDKP